MDDQSTGRGVYLVRRILAVLVILLLLALLVPQAYQALLGPRDESGSRTQDTADVDGSGDGGSREEGASNEEIAGVRDDVAEQEGASDNPSYSGETGVSKTAPRTSRGVETSEDEYGGVENIELDADLAETGEVLDEPSIGEGEQIVLSAVIDAGGQQIIQPIAFVEPLVEDPIVSAYPVCCDNLAYYDDPAYYGDWAYYDDPTYYSDWAYYDDSAYDEYLAAYDEYLAAYDEYLATYYEQQSLEEPDAPNAYDSVAYETVSEGEGGGSGAYAAISTG